MPEPSCPGEVGQESQRARGAQVRGLVAHTSGTRKDPPPHSTRSGLRRQELPEGGASVQQSGEPLRSYYVEIILRGDHAKRESRIYFIAQYTECREGVHRRRYGEAARRKNIAVNGRLEQGFKQGGPSLRELGSQLFDEEADTVQVPLKEECHVGILVNPQILLR